VVAPQPVDVHFLLLKENEPKEKVAATFICYSVLCFNLGLYYPQNTDAAKSGYVRAMLLLFLFVTSQLRGESRAALMGCAAGRAS